MESTSTIYEILAATWLSGALLAWWQLFLPSMKIIRVLEPDNLVVRFVTSFETTTSQIDEIINRLKIYF